MRQYSIALLHANMVLFYVSYNENLHNPNHHFRLPRRIRLHGLFEDSILSRNQSLMYTDLWVLTSASRTLLARAFTHPNNRLYSPETGIIITVTEFIFLLNRNLASRALA